MTERETLYHVQLECEKKRICLVLGSGCYCGECIRSELTSRDVDLYVLATGASTLTLIEELECEGSAVVRFEASDNETNSDFISILKKAGYRAEKASNLSCTAVVSRGDTPDGFRIRWKPCSEPYLEDELQTPEPNKLQTPEPAEESDSTTNSGGISDVEDSYSSDDDELYEGYMVGDHAVLTTLGDEVMISGVYPGDQLRPHCTVLTRNGYTKQVTACRLRPIARR